MACNCTNEQKPAAFHRCGSRFSKLHKQSTCGFPCGNRFKRTERKVWPAQVLHWRREGVVVGQNVLTTKRGTHRTRPHLKKNGRCTQIIPHKLMICLKLQIRNCRKRHILIWFHQNVHAQQRTFHHNGTFEALMPSPPCFCSCGLELQAQWVWHLKSHQRHSHETSLRPLHVRAGLHNCWRMEDGTLAIHERVKIRASASARKVTSMSTQALSDDPLIAQNLVLSLSTNSKHFLFTHFLDHSKKPRGRRGSLPQKWFAACKTYGGPT